VQGKVGSTWKSLNSGPSAHWVKDGIVSVIVQLGVRKSSDIPADVPLALDLATSPEDRQVLEVLCAPGTTGYPSFMGPGVPRERVEAVRTAYAAAMTGPSMRCSEGPSISIRSAPKSSPTSCAAPRRRRPRSSARSPSAMCGGNPSPPATDAAFAVARHLAAPLALHPPRLTTSPTSSRQDRHLYLGYPPGGAYDIYARLIARFLSRHMPGNPQFIVRHKPGAASLNLVNELFHVVPRDGSVIGMFARSVALNRLLGREGTNFDPVAFNWIGSANNEVSFCGVWHGVGVRSTEDFLLRPLVFAANAPGAESDVYPNVLNNLLALNFPGRRHPGVNDLTLALERGSRRRAAGAGLGRPRNPIGSATRKFVAAVQAELKTSRNCRTRRPAPTSRRAISGNARTRADPHASSCKSAAHRAAARRAIGHN
jgi:hypothetical protein